MTPVFKLPEQETFCLEPSTEFQIELDEKPLETSVDQKVVQNFISESDPLDTHSWLKLIDSKAALTDEPNHSNPPNFDKCIVCARIFKNPNSLEKHLKNVHTAHVIRPELTTSIKKSSEYRRIVLNKKPIKENVAKALVSKLSKKSQQAIEKSSEQCYHNQMNNQKTCTETSQTMLSDVEWKAPKSQNANFGENSENNNSIENGNTIIIISNVEINPANSPSYGYTFTNCQGNTMMPRLVPIGAGHNQTMQQDMDNIDNTVNTGSDSMITNRHSPKLFIIDKITEESAKINPKSPDEENEYHQCVECEKVFQKKYQLKRHQDIHENMFYFCPFCKRAPVKARSSLRKHLLKDHSEHQETWQVSNFMSTLLRKYEKVKKSSQKSFASTKKPKKESKVKKEPKKKNRKKEKMFIMMADSNDQHCEIIHDRQLPQGDEAGDENGFHQHQQIILSNIFLDPITLDEENNLIKYTLTGDDDFMNSDHNGDGSGMNHAGSIESYEMSEFSNFKSSFDEIQEKLDADLEFNNDEHMIKWNVELNDEDSVTSSPGSDLSSPDMSKSLNKNKEIDSFMLS
jgi:Zinc finger, C2H2 type